MTEVEGMRRGVEEAKDAGACVGELELNLGVDIGDEGDGRRSCGLLRHSKLGQHRGDPRFMHEGD